MVNRMKNKDYKTILNDPQIQGIYQELEENDTDWYLDHGWGHVSRVMNRTEELMQLAGASEEEVQEAVIAAFLHDVGKLEGAKDHAERSYRFAKEYFKKNKIDFANRKCVQKAIRVHSDGFDADEILALSLILADKLDQCPARLKPAGYEKAGVRQTQHLLEIKTFLQVDEFNDGCFVVDFITDGKLDMGKAAPICFDPFNHVYHRLGEAVGRAMAFILSDQGRGA